jgi:serine/threonine-protein kinase
VQVPDVRNKLSQDAIIDLQKLGFQTRTQQKPDSTVQPDRVIATEPATNSAVSAGDVITVIVSTGPEQRQVPDVSQLSFAEAVSKLNSAGFTHVRQTTAPSPPELQDKVLSTDPPANTASAITNQITVVIGSGPEKKDVPNVAGQTVDLATRNLGVYGFNKISQSLVDSTQTAGLVTSTNPPAGANVPIDTVIDLQVSKGNQFTMPDLTGMFWTDAEPQLRALGWTGLLVKGADVPAGDAAHNRVIYQSPSAGGGINRDANITLKFGS